jgi:hypothetical protein
MGADSRGDSRTHWVVGHPVSWGLFCGQTDGIDDILDTLKFRAAKRLARNSLNLLLLLSRLPSLPSAFLDCTREKRGVAKTNKTSSSFNPSRSLDPSFNASRTLNPRSYNRDVLELYNTVTTFLSWVFTPQLAHLFQSPAELCACLVMHKWSFFPRTKWWSTIWWSFL